MVWPFLYPVKTQEGPRWCVDSGEGKLPKRRRWKFQSKTAAERKAAELRGVWESYGRSGFMSDVDRADVLAARAKLAEFQLANTRLVEAVDFYILHKKPHGGDVTLQELFDKLIVERELSPRPPSPSYRRSLDEILGPEPVPGVAWCNSGHFCGLYGGSHVPHVGNPWCECSCHEPAF